MSEGADCGCVSGSRARLRGVIPRLVCAVYRMFLPCVDELRWSETVSVSAGLFRGRCMHFAKTLDRNVLVTQ